MKRGNTLLDSTPTTIFTVMSALAARHEAINLGQGFPDTEGPPDIVAAAAAALLDQQNQYPPLAGLPALRAGVADVNRRFYGLDIDPAEEVVVTSGATEALTACLMALIDPGDEVVLIEPFYDTYLPVVRLLGGVARLVRLREPAADGGPGGEPGRDWTLPRDELAAAFSPRTKAILLNTPMNPTGKVFTPDELAFVASLLRAHDAYAICDEVYEHLVWAPARHVPLMSLPGMRERCLRVGSAGKTFSLTGWKVGYVTAPAPLARLAMKAHQNLTFTTPPNLQRAVAFGLAKETGYFSQLASDLAAKCRLFSDGLRSIGFAVLPSAGGYFVIADFRPLGFDGGADAFCRYITERAGVAAIPVAAFYAAFHAAFHDVGGEHGGRGEWPGVPRHLVRFAFCKRDAVLIEALARLRSLFHGGHSRIDANAKVS